ncbi:hypothetical protein [Streptomyces sp. 2P-4]|uniref:hypothetical protein n=1 Tax=Streptomyces sp. 2P-4 TaxID=2931974 RepID=UPI002541CEC0|nr:hypothetical protein [Streptomyces sp. 2P-4]
MAYQNERRIRGRLTARNTARPAARRTAATALAALTALTLAGCGSPDGTSVEKANDQLRSTSFHSSGTTTAFAGGSQEAWWDPKEGFHLKASWPGGSGEVFCKDGKTYTSASMLANSLRDRGQSITVPPELFDRFITSKAEGGCTMFFEIPEAAEHNPDADRTAQGKQARAYTASAGGARDTYYLESGTSRLLELASTRNGQSSTTQYDSYGEKFPLTLPEDEKTIPMEDFRRRVKTG